MSSELAVRQFELGGVVFGLDAPLHVEASGFKPGGLSWRTQDGTAPQGDYVDFGRDFLTPDSWGWDLFTIAEEEKQALADVADLEAVWRATGVRDRAQKVMPLRYCLTEGVTRVIYGRPNRWTPSYNNLLLNGYIPVTCDFRRVDTLHYDDVEQELALTLQPSQATGLSDPLRDPLGASSASAPPRTDTVTIAGNQPTWITVEFSGEQSFPRLTSTYQTEVDGEIESRTWDVRWDGDLAFDEGVIIDPRPWRRNVLYKSGGSASSKLNRRTKLADILLPPGEHVITYTANSSGGSAAAKVRWRDASSSP